MSPIPRLRLQRRRRICERCGGSLQAEAQRKYDAFWIVLLICLGAALAFYLFGVVVMLIGLWLWSQKKTRWVCPSCAPNKL